MSPTLVSHRVHVTVVAREIAPTVYLQQELPEWSWLPATGKELVYAERGRPLRPRSVCRTSYLGRQARPPPAVKRRSPVVVMCTRGCRAELRI